MRTRLCIHPSARSWRMPASTNGYPVRPSHQAANRRSASAPSSCTIASKRRSSDLRADAGFGGEDVGVELPPRQLGAEHRMARVVGQLGQQGAGVDLAPSQVGGEPAGRGEVRAVAVGPVPVEGAGTAELLPSGQRCALARLGQLDAGEVGLRGPRVVVDRRPPQRLVGRIVGRWAPAVRQPRPVERREDAVPRAVILADASGGHGVGGLGPHQQAPGSAQRGPDGVVPGRSVRAEVRADVHLGRPCRGRDRGDDRGRVPRAQQQGAPEALAKGGQRPQQPGLPDRPGRTPQRVVEHEQRHHPAVAVHGGTGRSSEQRGVVVAAEVAAEPEHGRHVMKARPLARAGHPGRRDRSRVGRRAPAGGECA